MAALLAWIGQSLGAGRRVVRYRLEEHHEALPGALRGARPGALCMLVGEPGSWRDGNRVDRSPWPAALPQRAQLKDRSLTREIAELPSRGGYTVQWSLDREGYPCEIWQFTPGAHPRWLLNYAGWHTAHLEFMALEVWSCALDSGEQVWIVPPVSRNRPDTGASEFRKPAPPRPAPSQSLDRAAPIVLQLTELEFLDGRVRFRHLDRTFEVQWPPSRPVLNDLREALQDRIETPLRARCRVLPDGMTDASIDGLDELEAHLEAAEEGHFVRTSVERDGWLDADELVKKWPGRSRPRSIEDLLNRPELRLDTRAGGLRKMVSRQARGARLLLLRGRAALVPLPASDGGPLWYAWEVIGDDLATYLFRPEGDSSLEQLQRWTQDPDHRRKELLRDVALRVELGFQRRVFHRREDEDLGPWWRELCAAVGLVE